MKVAAFALGLLILAALLWGGSELHYRSCVSAANDRYPPLVPQGHPARQTSIFGGGGLGSGGLSDQAVPPHDRNQAKRTAAIDGCSHLPF